MDLAPALSDGDALVLATFTELVELVSKSLCEHVSSLVALGATAVQTGDTSVVNPEACRMLRELFIEARRRAAKCTDLLKRFSDHYKLTAAFELSSSQPELLECLGLGP